MFKSVGLPHLFLPPFFTWGETKRRISKLKTERMQGKKRVEKAVFSVAKKERSYKNEGRESSPGRRCRRNDRLNPREQWKLWEKREG